MDRRISSLVSIGLLALLSACGGGGGGGGGGSPTPTPPPPADTTPDGFTFTAQSGSDPSSAVTSNEVTITGINAASAVSITGGTYSINGGAFTSGAGSVTNGQRIQVRLTSSAQFLTASSASLTVGGVAGSFTTTTRDADRIPEAFAFANKTDANRDAWVASDTVMLTGFEVPLALSIEGGEYSLGGGAFTSTAGTASAGQTLAIRARSGAGWSRNTRVNVTLGSVTATFNLTTALPDYTPDDIAYDGADTLYLLSAGNRLVFRWSVAESHYLDPIELSASGAAPGLMAYSKAQHRLYFGYSTGEIRYIDVDATTPAENSFAMLAASVASLGEAGNFIVAQASTYYSGGGVILNSNGSVTGNGGYGYYYGYSRATDWDETTGRLYYMRDGLSPNDLHYDVINQSTGTVSSNGETPYHGSYNVQAPIRVSNDGAYVLLGSGDLYAQGGLAWAGSLGSAVTDARWFADGSLAALTTDNSETLLRRLGNANLTTLERVRYPGTPLRVAGTDERMAVVVLSGGTVRIHTYLPSDDSDADGVANTTDAFPIDVAASVDTDHDGYPDGWNSGRTQADSTTNLAQDAFPQDSACWLAAHGSGGSCNFAATLPNYTPDQVVQQGDIVYLLSAANRRVYRWSIASETYLNPYVVGLDQGFTSIAPTRMAVSPAHQRLYLGYATGAIRYIDLTAASGAETHLANTSMDITALVSAGNYLLAHGYSSGYGYGMQYVLSDAGTVTDSSQSSYYSEHFAWDANTSRVYWFNQWSSYLLHYQVVSQATGKITSTGDAPYDPNYYYKLPPLRVSQDGQRLLLGSGEVFEQAGLTRTGATGAAHIDARWMANGSVVTLATDGTQSLVRRLASSGFGQNELFTFNGQALRVVGSDTKMALVYLDGGTTRFRVYVPNDDTDNDGVANTLDAFPTDRAASADTDLDGFPDAWNAGRSQADSTTGLTLDAYAQDSACWLLAHGSGGVCNHGSTVPAFRPDDIQQQGDIIYLLSTANRRIYRWSISGGAYLNPYVAKIDAGLTTVSPTAIAYVNSQQRLYVGYGNGFIRYIDVNAATPTEVPFAALPNGVSNLGAAGNLLVAQGAQYSYDSGYILNSSGVVTGKGGYYYGYSQETAWDPVTGRLYYMREGLSPNDLHYDVIDQATGVRTATAETPYHSEYVVGGVIRPSPGGQTIFVGSGGFYNQANLTWAGSLGAAVVDARWLANGSLATLASSNNQTILRRLGSGNLANVEQVNYTGEALRLVGSDSAMVVVVLNNNVVEFHDYVPNDDSDGDGVQNTTDDFPLDPAASLDSDHDGRPDAWNAGQGQGDSTMGLVLDAYPQDSACWLLAHGSGGVCNPASTVPDYIPDQVVVSGNIVYLLSNANYRVYRWSIATGAYLNPYVVGVNTGFTDLTPVKIEHSTAHQRLYLAYQTGEIRYLATNVANPLEARLTVLDGPVTNLASAGNFLVAQLGYNYYANGSRVLTSGGVVTAQGTLTGYYGGEYAFDPVYSRLYWASAGYSYALSYEVIDQGTGQITSTGNTPYTGYTAQPPPRVSADGELIVLGNGDVYARDGLVRQGASLGKAIEDARWRDNVLVDVDSTDLVEIRDASTRQVLQSYQYTGQPISLAFGTSEAYLIHILNGTTSFLRLPFYDQDGDQIPRWWELLYANGGAGMSDMNAADATTDLDGDGVNNRNEYLNHSNPLVSDTDGDGLSDFAEINTWNTNPMLPDTDGDGLADGAEVNTHNSDPLDADTDGDGYSDVIEVLYGGDPNDVSGLPTPLTSAFSEDFDGTPDLSAWYSPPQAGGAWTLDNVDGFSGTQSFKSSAVAESQSTATRFRGFFRAGGISFTVKVNPGYCCNRMTVSIDGVAQLNISSGDWLEYTLPITAGVHEIEFRYERVYGSANDDVAWIEELNVWTN